MTQFMWGKKKTKENGKEIKEASIITKNEEQGLQKLFLALAQHSYRCQSGRFAEDAGFVLDEQQGFIRHHLPR
ncbi:hypothetical protein L3X38_005672 [Prunus dulcis]|uniref:Uncharacterized protein n=1 Tax=Prunus dulcis TaxID=3755 RepID=A0AAD4ZR85_PRUDU|nr:hypothetical protein L3X38_005672 [Prunus dulcis]